LEEKKMKKGNLGLGILVMVLIFGMTVVGCDDGSTDNGVDPALNGTWVGSVEGVEGGYTFNNGSIEISINGTPATKGTYTTSGNKITVKQTQLYGTNYGLEPKWYPIETGLIEAGAPDEIIAQATSQQTLTYTISGNILTITNQGQTITFTITYFTAHNRSVTVRRLTAARLHNTPVGLMPFVMVCPATFFCARKNALHFSSSGAKKRQLYRNMLFIKYILFKEDIIILTKRIYLSK